METLKATSTKVNFLRIDQKINDWRYETSKYLSNKREAGSKTIYWIGILNLRSIEKEQNEYPLSFITNHGTLKEDSEWSRDHDGAQREGVSAVLYNLKNIMPELLSAKEGGKDYVHLLIKEVVNANGQLSAYALIDQEKDGADSISYGWFRSNETWYEMPTYKTAYLSYLDISKLTELLIRSTNSYNWQK